MDKIWTEGKTDGNVAIMCPLPPPPPHSFGHHQKSSLVYDLYYDVINLLSCLDHILQSYSKF